MFLSIYLSIYLFKFRMYLVISLAEKNVVSIFLISSLIYVRLKGPPPPTHTHKRKQPRSKLTISPTTMIHPNFAAVSPTHCQWFYNRWTLITITCLPPMYNKHPLASYFVMVRLSYECNTCFYLNIECWQRWRLRDPDLRNVDISNVVLFSSDSHIWLSAPTSKNRDRLIIRSILTCITHCTPGNAIVCICWLTSLLYPPPKGKNCKIILKTEEKKALSNPLLFSQWLRV